MTLDPQLLAIVVCPVDKGPLYPVGETPSGDTPAALYNPRLRRSYAVVDGNPDLLPDEATEVDDAVHAEYAALIESGATQPTGGGVAT